MNPVEFPQDSQLVALVTQVLQFELHGAHRLLDDLNVPSSQVVTHSVPRYLRYLVPVQVRQLVAAVPLQVAQVPSHPRQRYWEVLLSPPKKREEHLTTQLLLESR